MTRSTPSIAVAPVSALWRKACPTAARLVRAAARRTLRRGFAVSGWTLPSGIEVGISLSDDARQQRLNRDHRGLDLPTNVLAFPAWVPGEGVPPGAPLLLGDVVLAFETVAREAWQQRTPFSDHLSHLTVHGVLHLLGYDHLTPGEAAAMESLESSILASLGVPNPWRDTM